MQIRTYNPKIDEKLVVGNFLDCIGKNGLLVQVMSKEAKKIFMDRAKKDFIKILNIADTMVALEGEEEVLVAWTCMSIHKYSKVLHFCYTSKNFRRLGYQSSLFKEFHINHEEEIDCSYWTYAMKQSLGKYNFKYNPYQKNSVVHDAV